MFEYRGCHDQWVVFEVLAVRHFGVATFSTGVEVTSETVETIRSIVLYQGSFRPTVRVLAPKIRWAHVGRPNSKKLTTLVTGEAGARHLAQHI